MPDVRLFVTSSRSSGIVSAVFNVNWHSLCGFLCLLSNISHAV